MSTNKFIRIEGSYKHPDTQLVIYNDEILPTRFVNYFGIESSQIYYGFIGHKVSKKIDIFGRIQNYEKLLKDMGFFRYHLDVNNKIVYINLRNVKKISTDFIDADDMRIIISFCNPEPHDGKFEHLILFNLSLSERNGFMEEIAKEMLKLN